MIYENKSFTKHQKPQLIKEYKKFFYAIIFFIGIFFATIFLFPDRSASAENKTDLVYRISSIQIQEGDSLWNIATKYYTDDFNSIHDYINEIKRMNCMKSDRIYKGGYLLIPHYSK